MEAVFHDETVRSMSPPTHKSLAGDSGAKDRAVNEKKSDSLLLDRDQVSSNDLEAVSKRSRSGLEAVSNK